MTFIKVILPFLFLIPLLIIYRKSIRNIQEEKSSETPAIISALVLGIGMGGFADAIVLHQILQWHQMVSNQIIPNSLSGKSINMFWDGIFDSVSWVFTLSGIMLLWHSSRRKEIDYPLNVLLGGLIAGWGIFNFLDSILNHFLFRLHNVREQTANPQLWNTAFLLCSLLLLFAGWLLIKKKDKNHSFLT